MKWNGILRSSQKGGTQALVENGALKVRVIGGSAGSVDSVARAAAAAAQAEIDNYTDFAADGTEVIIGKAPGGATLYRKSIAIAAGPAATPTDYPHGIAGLLTVEKQWGRLTRISTNAHVPLPYVHLSVPIQMSVQGTDIHMDSAGNFSTFSGRVYLEYTRS